MALKGEQQPHSSRRLTGWVASLSLGVALIFGLFYVERALGASFYVLLNRNVDSTAFSVSLVSPALDPTIWGATIFVVLGCFLLASFVPKVSKGIRGLFMALSVGLAITVCSVFAGVLGNISLVFVSVILFAVCIYFAGLFGFSQLGMLKRVLLGSALLAFAVEAGALVLYNLPYVLNLPVASSALAVNWRLVELSLVNSAYPLLPYAYLVFVLLGLAAFLWELARVNGLSKKLSLTRLQAKVESLKVAEFTPGAAHFPLWLALLISFILTLFLVEITVLPWFNPTSRLVAVDAPPYYQWLDQMRGLEGGEALQFALGNDRALLLVASYALSFGFPKVSVIQFMPALLVPLFTVVSLYLVRLVCGFRESWVYLVLLAPFSIQSLALIYSGYFANMLAAVFVYFYFALLLKLNGDDTWRMLLMLGVSLCVVFSHSWTWYIFVVSLVGFLLLEWRNAGREHVKVDLFKQKALVVGLTAVVGLLADYSRTQWVGRSASSGVVVFETARSGLSLPNPGYILSGLQMTANFYLGGVFSSGLLLALSVVGFLFLLSFKSSSSRLLVSWFVVGCVAVLLASGEYIFNRFMFLMPSLVFCALGLTLLVRYCDSHGEGRKRAVLEALLVGLVFLLLLNFALGYTSNINI